MNSLYSTFNILNRMNDIKNEYSDVKNLIYICENSRKNKILNNSKKVINTIFIIFIGIFVIVNKPFSSISRFFDILIYSIVYIIIFYIIKKLILNILGFLVNKLKNNQDEKINEYKNELKELEIKYDILNDELNKSDIPKDYRKLDIIKWFIKAYENKRANNISELINLYESEIRSIEQNNKIQEIINENRYLNEKIEDLEYKLKKGVKVKK